MSIAKPLFGTQLNIAHPLARGLVGCWLFNERSGLKAYDSSGFGNTGTLSGSTIPTWTNDISGTSLLFNGTTANVNAGLSYSIRPGPAITYLVRVTFNSFAKDYAALIGRQPGQAGGDPFCSLLIRTTGKLAPYLYTYNGATIDYDATGIYTLTTNTLYSVAMTYDVTTGLYGYVNGAVDHALVAANGNIAATNSDYDYVDIGACAGTVPALDRYTAGYISSAMIWNRALTAYELTYLHAFPYAMFDATSPGDINFSNKPPHMFNFGGVI